MAVAKRIVESLNFEKKSCAEVSKKRRFSSPKTPLSSSSNATVLKLNRRSATEFCANRRGFLRFRALSSSSVLRRKKRGRDSGLNDQEEKQVLDENDDSTTQHSPIQVFDESFRPLDEEEKAQVKDAFSVIDSTKVLVSHKNSNIDITRETFQCLMPTVWLNDEVVNLYLELLKEREARDPVKYLKCHFFNSFFYKRLLGGSSNTYNYNAVWRWTTKKKLGYDLIDCDMIFVPIHEGIHWTLAVINMKERKFMYLDSLLEADPTKILKAMAKYLVDEVKDKSGKHIDVSLWDIGSVKNLPRQQNRDDCGMFMLKYIDFYSRGLSLDFCQKDMPYFRLRTAKEILRLRAD